MEVKYARSFSDYIKIISELPDTCSNDYRQTEPEVLWFRGLDYGGHPLIPSLYRVAELVNTDSTDGENYLKLKYAEDLRTQHYIAKNYHYYSKLPASRLEWLEVMQHHSVKTRVLDWSESAIHSLIFAVEAFLDANRYDNEKRKRQFPCVWVLKPQKLNSECFNIILSNNVLQEKLISELQLTKKELVIFNNKIKECKKFLKRNCSSKDNSKAIMSMKHLENIVNLSSINDEINMNRNRLKQLIFNDEIFPLFYLLSRTYSDGIVVDDRTIPPLSVVHPFHSERIKAQKGVFTVFPFYKEQTSKNEADTMFRNMKVDFNAMQYNIAAKNALTKIELVNPEKIACELLSNGINASWLYPELPIVSNEIETHKIY